MTSLRITEGEADFNVPAAGKACKMWYKIFGDLSSGTRPLVGLRGGPGVGHNYLLSLEDLASNHGITVILYDQLGTRNSTHLQYKHGDASLWAVDLFLKDLNNLLKHLDIQEDYDVFGNSWGGMLDAEHGVRQPVGLHRLVIAVSPADMGVWVVAANKLRRQLLQDVQDVLKRHEDDGTTDSPEYEEAVMEFFERHLCKVRPMPEEVVSVFDNIKRDPTIYHTMFNFLFR